MSDYFKSAFGYLNGATPGGSSYIGQLLEISGVKLRVNRVIAEGGWAIVYAVEDLSTGQEYALKRMIAVDSEAQKLITQEIEILKILTNHPNIIKFLCVQKVERENKKESEYLLVTELCPGGTLADTLRSLTASDSPLSIQQICRISYQATRAIHHMHTQKPNSFIHRDIKLENFLIGNDGLIKLCDFGSVTMQHIQPDISWNAQKRANLEDHLAKFTTPMYRAPEILDTWNNEPIGTAVDIWALGCIIYTLVSLKHPFSEGNKLAIVNGKFPPLPSNPRLSCFYDIIKGCLHMSPSQRLSTSMILERLASIAESNNFDPCEPPKIDVVKLSPTLKPASLSPGNSTHSAPSRPAPPRPVPPTIPPHRSAPPSVPPQRTTSVQNPTHKPGQQSSSGLFSSLKGGAGSFLRNIKDTSSKVMQSVQQSMNRTELDASYLTSRILIMPYPADGLESAYKVNHIEDVRAFLQSRHPPPTKIQYYNLTKGKPNVTRLTGRHIDCSFVFAPMDANAPLLSAIYQICQDIYRFLDADVHHMVILYCIDGFHASAIVACALLLFAKVVSTTEEAINLFLTRRCQPPQLQPSELRTINYVGFLSNGKLPHTKSVAFKSLTIQPVPLFTRAKDGCRPYIEIYSNGAMLFSTKKQDYEDLKLFNTVEDKVSLALCEAVVRGDITIVIYHARQQLGRPIGIKIASVHFHTGFINPIDGILKFEKNELDDAPEMGVKFRVTIHCKIVEDSGKFSRVPAPWEVEDTENLCPDPLFASTLEMEETVESFKIRKPQFNVLQEKNTRSNSLIAEKEKSENNAENSESNKLAEADLLNLGTSNSKTSNFNNNNTLSPNADPTLDIFSSNASQDNISDDLLGSFSSFTQTQVTASKSFQSNDLLLNQSSDTILNGQGNTDILFDPFGSASKDNLLGNWCSTTSSQVKLNDEGFPRNSSVPNFPTESKDPFASLTSLGSGLPMSGSKNSSQTNIPQMTSPISGTPIHGNLNKMPQFLNSDCNNEPKLQKSGDAFEDLLGSQGYNFFTSRKAEKEGPKTINEMRKVEAAKTMDPDKMKISEWTEGKQGNLRALLCSLHTVLWPEADKWQKCEMHHLVTTVEVKKAYRKACLAVHPDKQVGTDNEGIAKLIFMELNNAWSAFENDTSQHNLFS